MKVGNSSRRIALTSFRWLRSLGNDDRKLLEFGEEVLCCLSVDLDFNGNYVAQLIALEIGTLLSFYLTFLNAAWSPCEHLGWSLLFLSIRRVVEVIRLSIAHQLVPLNLQPDVGALFIFFVVLLNGLPAQNLAIGPAVLTNQSVLLSLLEDRGCYLR